MSSNVLDLSGADSAGFAPVPSNRYNVRVHKVEMSEVKNEGKMAIGTPMVKVQLKITSGPCEDKLVFDQFTLPPKDYEKADMMLGFFIRFLMALGYDEAKVKSKGFDLNNLEDLIGKEAVATVILKPAKGQYDESNEVKGYKPAGTEIGGGSGSNII